MTQGIHLAEKTLMPSTATHSLGLFPSTRWTLIGQMQDGSPTAEHRHALDTICRSYWYPLYVYARRFGKNEEEAKDAVQELFAHLIQGEHLRQASPLRGKLRTFLLTSLRNLMHKEHQRQNALKRGGGVATVPLELRDAEGRYVHDAISTDPSPEREYERKWAITLLKLTREKLRASYAADGKGHLFDLLSPALVAGEQWDGQDEAAKALNMNVGALRVALHRLRKRYREFLLREVASTVSNDGDIRGEMAYLMSLFS